MILIAYDGSEDAQAAIAHAGDLFPGEAATVLTVWETFIDALARTGAGMGMIPGTVDTAEIDTMYERGALETAQEGAERAAAAGLQAEAHARLRDRSIANAILMEANCVEARAIVVGSRGLTGVRSALMGSVSNAVLHHADRPIVVVTSDQTAAARRRP